MAKDNFVEDILKSTKESVVERLSSPLLGSFTIAWCGWNYKFLVILFSAAPVTRTLELINTYAFPDTATRLVYGLVAPTLTALAYVFLYPYPAKWISGFTLRRQVESNAQRQAIEGELLITKEEAKKIRAAAGELQLELDKAYEVIEQLREALRARSTTDTLPKDSESKTSVTSETPKSPESKQITETQFRLLRALEEIGGTSTERGLIKLSQSSKIAGEFDIGELEIAGLVRRNYDQEDEDYIISFEHEGRRVLVMRENENGSSSKTQPHE